MIVFKVWHKAQGIHRLRWEGWFLLGFIPIYVRQSQYVEKS